MVLEELIEPAYLLPVAIIGLRRFRSFGAHEQHFVVDIGLAGPYPGFILGVNFWRIWARTTPLSPEPLIQSVRIATLPSRLSQWWSSSAAILGSNSISVDPCETMWSSRFGPCSFNRHSVTVYFLGPDRWSALERVRQYIPNGTTVSPR